jgi:hypothetical protein
MKHIKLFEEFVNEAFKKEYGQKLTLAQFEKLKPGSEVLYRGAKFEIEENNGVTLVLKGERGNLSVNFSMFNESGALLEAEEISEARTINSIQNEWTKHTSKMKETAAEWKEASGKAKDSLLAKLKEMTQKKKEIEKELYDAISLKDKDLELAFESLGEDLEEALALIENSVNEGDMTKDYDGFIVLNGKTKKLYKFKYVKGTKNVQVENDAIAKLMKELDEDRSRFMVHGLIRKGEWDNTKAETI